MVSYCFTRFCFVLLMKNIIIDFINIKSIINNNNDYKNEYNINYIVIINNKC